MKSSILLSCILLAACAGESDSKNDIDTDLDGVFDRKDNCPLIANADQQDTDGDGVGDVCDSDRDGDGVHNDEDDFPGDPNEYLDLDGDGVGHNTDKDNDGDGFPDKDDNCPYVSNSDQTDSNGNGIGDACSVTGLNDTGQNNSGGYEKDNYENCENPATNDPKTLKLQDCSIGRDALARKGELVKKGGGEAGFDFTKLGANGEPLADQSDNGLISYCVQDNVTGLIWERKHLGNGNEINSTTDRYYWYNSNPETNAGNAGAKTATTNDGDTPCEFYDEEDETTWCNTENYIKRMNEYGESGFCGLSNWRLPTVEELSGLIHYGQLESGVIRAISEDYFPNLGDGRGSNITYWTSTSNARLPGNAWGVVFSTGSLTTEPKALAYYVRLVNDPKPKVAVEGQLGAASNE